MPDSENKSNIKVIEYSDRLLELLLKTFPGLDIYLVVDNATYHRSKMVKKMLAKNPKIRLIPRFLLGSSRTALIKLSKLRMVH